MGPRGSSGEGASSEPSDQEMSVKSYSSEETSLGASFSLSSASQGFLLDITEIENMSEQRWDGLPRGIQDVFSIRK